MAVIEMVVREAEQHFGLTQPLTDSQVTGLADALFECNATIPDLQAYVRYLYLGNGGLHYGKLTPAFIRGSWTAYRELHFERYKAEHTAMESEQAEQRRLAEIERDNWLAFELANDPMLTRAEAEARYIQHQIEDGKASGR